MRSKTAVKHKGDDMSKFLKFIVNLFLILAIIVTAGIIVPPLLGVNTTIVDTAGMDTNLPLGSVTYSRDKAVMELASGDEILKESGTSTYAYIVQEGDAATGEFTVVSATEPDASPETVILRNSVSEVVLTIPYIGFVVVAMQSLEGRIIIGLVILFIIILFILSELWKKRDDDEYDEDDNESGDRGNAQAASAEKTGDAERVATRTGTGTGYSENVTDNRGYGTVSQDTASIAAAMAGLESVTGRRETPDNMPADEDIPSGIQADDASSNDLQADEASVNDTDSDVLSDAELSIGSVSGGALQEVPADENPEITVTPPAGSSNEPAVDAMNIRSSIEEPKAPESTGDTKVFPGSFTSQVKSLTEESETSGLHVEKTIEEALIAESENAAASWSDTTAEEEQEPKRLWSWTDEPFENELDGDSWNSFPARNSGSANEYPERFAPVERMTRQEIIEQARSGGNEPKIQRDEVTGIDIIDYSNLL